jgi:hypothetical protein
VLALPQGWCCLFAAQLAKLTASATPAKAASCCSREVHPQRQAPGDAPSNLPPSRCPCSDRHTVRIDSTSVENPHVEFASISVLPDLDPAQVLIGVDWQELCVVHPPFQEHHVIQCVWRC